MKDASERFDYPHFDYVDILDFADQLEASPLIPVNSALAAAISAVRSSIDDCVFAEWHDIGGDLAHPNAHGISVFFPSDAARYEDQQSMCDYGSLEFNTDTSQYDVWDEMLRRVLEVPVTLTVFSLPGCPQPVDGTQYDVPPGDSVTVTAIASFEYEGDLYEFNYWILPDSTVSWDLTVTVTVNSDCSMIVLYTWIPRVELTVVSPPGGGSPVDGVYEYWARETSDDFTATLQYDYLPTSTRYTFSHWELDGNFKTSDQTTNVWMNCDHTLEAVYDTEPITTATLTYSLGTYSGTDVYPINTQSDAYTAVASYIGWLFGLQWLFTFTHFTLDGEYYSSSRTVSVWMDTDHNLQARYDRTPLI